jgi:hypothetical protein
LGLVLADLPENWWLLLFRGDELMVAAIKRQHEPQRIIGDLLKAEINEKQARSLKYQLRVAKLPLVKELD